MSTSTLVPVADRGHDRGGRGRGRLAHPAGTAGDDDLLGREQTVHRAVLPRQLDRLGGRPSPSPLPVGPAAAEPHQ